MKIYIAFDDTDTLDCGRGTGKLARWFEDKIPSGCTMTGVVRHQLLVADDIPYTSHNSSLCMIIETEASSQELIENLIELGTDHIKEHFFEGSDPGLCIAEGNNPSLANLMKFARTCLKRKVSQEEAYDAAKGIHLSGHGGTNDGIIGAAAAVGLTFEGMSGRFIEIGGTKRLRDFAEITIVAEIREAGIELFSVDRHSPSPQDDEQLENKGWLRPRLFMNRPVIPVRKITAGLWEVVGYEKDHATE